MVGPEDREGNRDRTRDLPSLYWQKLPRRSGRRNLGVLGWAASGRLWRERGAGGGEARFERDAAEQPPPDLSARAAGELGRRGRFARGSPTGSRPPRCARRSGRRPCPAGKLGSPEELLPGAHGGEVAPAGWSRPGARRTDASSWVILSLLSRRSPLSLSLEGEGCRGEGKDGAGSLRFPGVALLEDFFPLQSLKRSVSRKSSVELGVSCRQAFAPTI